MRFTVATEKATGSYSAFVPNLSGCVATGKTAEEVEAQIREAIAFHLEGLREGGLPIPPPSSQVDNVEVAS
jgi:predicted RNase H-like HicB family nuclease